MMCLSPPPSALPTNPYSDGLHLFHSANHDSRMAERKSRKKVISQRLSTSDDWVPLTFVNNEHPDTKSVNCRGQLFQTLNVSILHRSHTQSKLKRKNLPSRDFPGKP